MFEEKKKTKRIDKIRNISGIIALILLISAIALGCTSCSNSYPDAFKVNINEETHNITILADEDIKDINLEFSIHTKEYGQRYEKFHFDEIKAHKLTTIELETTKNQNIEIEKIVFRDSETPLSSIFSSIAWILFFIFLPFGATCVIITILQLEEII